MQYRVSTSFTITSVADVSSFDAHDFTARLAHTLEVPPDAITLTVMAGSILVTAEIVFADHARATSVSQQLMQLGADPAAASTALGVTVSALTRPTMTVELVSAKLPPPHPSPFNGGAAADTQTAGDVTGGHTKASTIMGIVMLSILFLVALSVGGYCYMWHVQATRNRKRLLPLGKPSAASRKRTSEVIWNGKDILDESADSKGMTKAEAIAHYEKDVIAQEEAEARYEKDGSAVRI